MFDFILGPIPGLIGALLVLLLIGLISAKRVYKNAGANEALIITGNRPKKTRVNGQVVEESGIKVVKGGGVFLTPFFQKAAKLSLTSRAIEINVNAQDNSGITLTVEAVAIVKVGDTSDAIRAAAQRFLGQEKQIDNFAQEVLSGSLRASIGATDVSTIIKEREKLGLAVLEVARESLANQGLDVDSFEIKGIHDSNGYIQDLGRAEQARVRLLAEVAETNAVRESREAAVTAETRVAEAENSLALKKAALQLDTDRASAEAAAARPLAEALAMQAVVDAQQTTATRRASLRQAELESEVNAVADAEAYKARIEADAAAYTARANAEAAAAARVIAANGDRDARQAEAQAAVAIANGERDARKAAAEAVEAEGIADAGAILARGTAEAESTRLSAEALAQQSDALIQLRIIETLPQIAHELAAPMSNIDNLTVISTDGASQLSKNVASGFTEVDSVLKSTMGIGVSDLLSKFVGGAAAGAGFASSKPAATLPSVEGVIGEAAAALSGSLPGVAKAAKRALSN